MNCCLVLLDSTLDMSLVWLLYLSEVSLIVNSFTISVYGSPLNYLFFVFILFLSFFLSVCLVDVMSVKEMEQKKIGFHELPNTEIVESGTRLRSREIEQPYQTLIVGFI